ncbi:hypothetical protein ACLESO_23520 [Pyxidicoccus sp. 3LG]
MRMQRFIGSALLAVGLVASGCGGVEAEAEPSHLSTQEEELIPPCRSSYVIDYYSDATYTTWVGYESCDCGTFPYRLGQKTAFSIYWDGAVCTD